MWRYMMVELKRGFTERNKMKFSIRRNVFETNSSSIHSIAIVDNNKTFRYTKEEAIKELCDHANGVIKNRTLYYDKFPDTDKIFSWGVDIFDDFYHKMLYSLIDLYSEESFNDESSEFNELVSFLKKFLDIDKIEVNTKNEKFLTPFGEIDHQSTRLIYDVFQNNHDILLTDFLVDTKYILIIDNDNH